ncbi:hypothetical protein SLEP1_g34634 [Rubroshorea leprosula]|uniref:DUF4283 domain-containing protein n=1 Tax=Rubroshorea leprosula TaxID=152421 RepID=A0AAV5KKX3_9ROSI|nr:hypothetical protein SLEP1_g34634 [Rubroshorea leprosula]
MEPTKHLGDINKPIYAEVVQGDIRKRGEGHMNRRCERRTRQRNGSKDISTYEGQQREWQPKQQHQHWSGIELNFDQGEYAWLKKCFVGKVHSVNLIPNLQEKFFLEGVFYCKITPMEGRLVLLEGKEYEDLKELVDRGKDWMGQRFEEGLPVHAWKFETFQTFGRLWGNLISLDDSTSSKKRFDAARFLISTPSSESISKSITVKINGEFFILKFTEEESTNSLFTMRSDRVFHAPKEEEDEESSSLESQYELDSVKNMDLLEHDECQISGDEDGGGKEATEDELAIQNVVASGRRLTEDDLAAQLDEDQNKIEVTRHDDEVASYSKKLEGTRRKVGEIVFTNTEVVEETMGMGESKKGFQNPNSNSKNLEEGDTRKIMEDLKMTANKAGQGNLENDSQLSTNAEKGSLGKSNQKRKNTTKEGSRSSGSEEEYDRDLADGPPTKEMGLQEEMGRRVVDPHKPPLAGPAVQTEKTNSRPKIKIRQTVSSFWDDLDSDLDIPAPWMNSNDGYGRRKKKRKAKSCASVYRKTGGLEGILVQQNPGQRNASMKAKKEILFEKNLEKPVADDSINDSNIQNRNRSIEMRSKKRNTEALWSRIKEMGVTAQGEESVVVQKLKEMESCDKEKWRKEEEKKHRKGDQVMPHFP